MVTEDMSECMRQKSSSFFAPVDNNLMSSLIGNFDECRNFDFSYSLLLIQCVAQCVYLVKACSMIKCMIV